MNKKITKVWDKMDDDSKVAMKSLIHNIAEKRWQKLVDECVNEVISQPGDSLEKRTWIKVWRK